MPMLAAVTCFARRRRMHFRDSDAAAAPELIDQGQHQLGPAGDHRHRWRDRDEPAPVVDMPGRELRRPRAPPSGRQEGWRLPRDGGPAELGSRRRRHATVAAGSEQEEARGQPGRQRSSAAVALKKAPAAAGGARAGSGAASSPSSGASSPAAVLCAVCLEEVRPGEAAALPCSHSYHPGCVLPWFAAHGACPCCRAAVPSPAGRRTTNL
ncbi:unnamed protein product [Urochloa decumbens]|uniref:RING-type domain-containing protein n=1 Tax=Urochloa decumbens TaxID=240449 RepID=A0ABC9AID4_9POAL